MPTSGTHFLPFQSLGLRLGDSCRRAYLSYLSPTTDLNLLKAALTFCRSLPAYSEILCWTEQNCYSLCSNTEVETGVLDSPHLRVFVSLTLLCVRVGAFREESSSHLAQGLMLFYNEIALVGRVGTCSPKWGLGTSSTCVMWVLLRNADFQLTPDLWHQNLHFNKILGYLCTYENLSSTGLRWYALKQDQYLF